MNGKALFQPKSDSTIIYWRIFLIQLKRFFLSWSNRKNSSAFCSHVTNDKYILYNQSWVILVLTYKRRIFFAYPCRVVLKNQVLLSGDLKILLRWPWKKLESLIRFGRIEVATSVLELYVNLPTFQGSCVLNLFVFVLARLSVNGSLECKQRTSFGISKGLIFNFIAEVF